MIRIAGEGRPRSRPPSLTALAQKGDAGQDEGYLSGRERFLRSGARLFWRKGYAATSMADVVTESGSSTGNFYNFFSGKESLLLAVVEEYEGRLLGLMAHPGADRRLQPLDRLRALLKQYRELLRMSDFQLGCPLGRLAAEVTYSPEARRRIAQGLCALRDGIQECLEDGTDLVSRYVDTASLSAYILAVLEGAVIQAQVEGRIDPLDASIEHMMAHLSDILSSGPPE